MDYTEQQQKALLTMARDQIAGKLSGSHPSVIEDSAFQQQAATFVTLKKSGQLRGCIGTLEAIRSLCDDIRYNALAAAFRDTRFPPVTKNELDDLTIEISILDTPEAMLFDTEAELLSQLKPGVDGLILTAGAAGEYRSTFLPQVWQQLPDPQQFLNQLKLKAGLRTDYWGDDVSAMRYRVVSFAEASN